MRESSSLFPFQTANRHAVRSSESHDAWAGQLFPASRTPHQRRLPRPVASPVQTAALIRQQQQQCCCYLIYKLPVLWRSGAAARVSRLHTPVETGTPPRRYKLRDARFRLTAKAPTALFVSPPRESASLGFARTMRVRLELGSLSRIVTHFTVEMCYDFVTFCFFTFLPA